MCTDFDCKPAQRVDITSIRDGAAFSFIPRTAAANAWLSRKFAQVEGDLTARDATRILNQARAMGFVVEVLS